MTDIFYGLNLVNSNFQQTSLKIDEKFLSLIQTHDPELYIKVLKHRHEQINFSSDELIQIATYCQDFILDGFQIKNFAKIKTNLQNLKIIFETRRKFIQRYALTNYKDVKYTDIATQLIDLFGVGYFSDEEFLQYLCQPGVSPEKIETLAKYAAWATQNKQDNPYLDKSVLFNLHLDNAKLFDFSYLNNKEITAPSAHILRHGFSLPPALELAVTEANYCLFCHDRKKDSCRTGLFDKNNNLKTDSAGTPLGGCPLQQKVSEMNKAFKDGDAIAAFILAMLDNPFLLLTGNRICNDCSKACIFQPPHQTPVDIPLIESKILDIILNLDYGLEVYWLLWLWNPLKIHNFLPLEQNKFHILTVGGGPAGIALSYYLLHQGYNVSLVDAMTGLFKEKSPYPVKNYYAELHKSFENYRPSGIGGVMESGVTARWDKNYLNAISTLLSRFQNFSYYGGVNFGKNISTANALENFDHVAIATGVGTVKIPPLKNISTAKGVILASDLLYTLQVNGGNKIDNFVDLALTLPIAVIGGGLTAVDAAVEAMFFYRAQIKKIRQFFMEHNIDDARLNFSAQQKVQIEEYLAHYNLFMAAKTDREIVEVWKKIGPVQIVSRRSMISSPAYLTNHKEVEEALKYGALWTENFIPQSLKLDPEMAVLGITDHDGNLITAKTIILATGVTNNVVHAENSEIIIENGDFHLDGDNFTNAIANGKKITIFGDANRNYRGSVVKALASARDGIKVITDSCIKPSNKPLPELNQPSTLQVINKLNDNFVEVIIKSPLSHTATPGSTFKLFVPGKTDIDALTITALSIKNDTMRFMVYNSGATSRQVIDSLSPNQNVILSGPITSDLLNNLNGSAIYIAGEEQVFFAIELLKQSRENNLLIFLYKNEKNIDIIKSHLPKDIDFIPVSNIDEKANEIIQKFLQSNRASIISLTSRSFSLDTKQLEYFIHLPYKPQNCMLGGVCGKCIHYIDDSHYLYSCSGKVVNNMLSSFKNGNNFDCGTEIMRKINNLTQLSNSITKTQPSKAKLY